MKKLIISLFVSFFVLFSLNASENVTMSPDGLKEAYTQDGNLWLKDLSTKQEICLTDDGSNLVLNGYASWVYYEEIFGRSSNYRAFWWSPDSKKIAFYRFDDSLVPEFPIFSPFGQSGKLNLTRYPKAGQTNPEVRIGIIDISTREIVWADFDVDSEKLYGTPFFSDDSQKLYIQSIPRRQNHLDLFAVSCNDGSKQIVYSEDYPTWVDFIEGMIFTSKGFFMVRSFETGWEQIYFLNYNGKLERLTDGQNWNIDLLKYDEKKGDLYFTAKRDSRVHSSLYRLDKKSKVYSLSDPNYSISSIKFSEDFKTFSAKLSTASISPISIEALTKSSLRESVNDRDNLVFDDTIPTPRIVTIENDGYTLYGLMTFPKNFDSNKKYPVVMYVYGGPGTSYMNDYWGARFVSNEWMWENDIIYIVCNPRSSGESGRKGMDESFGRMTVVELGDYIAWNKWLKAQNFVNGGKIGVTGFSFGGTTTTMLVLRYPEYFCCGIAGGGVYDWTLYDSVYTERYMDTPQNNPQGYNEASVLTWIPKIFNDPSLRAEGVAIPSSLCDEIASDTSYPRNDECLPTPGALMLTHGTGDDNVHYQNTLLLIDALQKENYRFELMLYPDGMHGYRGHQAIHDETTAHHFWTEWFKK